MENIDFYTNVVKRGNDILVRGVSNGKNVQFRTHYEPTLYVEHTKDYGFKNVYNKNLKPITFENMYEASKFAQENKGSNMTLYGFPNFHNQFILENFSDCYNLIIDSDMFFIKNFDINSYMKDYNVASIIIDILPKLGHRLSPGFGLDSYFWNGVCIFKPDELKNLNELNWDCGRVNGNPVRGKRKEENLWRDSKVVQNVAGSWVYC